MIRISFKQLEIFVEIAKWDNVSTAAENLGLSQSACSMALSTLENQLSRVLFDRHGKQLTLNESGRYLLPKAIAVLDQIKDWQQLAMAPALGALSGHLILGASSTIGNYLLPDIIGEFIRAHPQVKMSLHIANSEQIVQQLQNFEIDLGIIEGSCHSPEITVTPWRSDELVVVAAPQHLLSQRTKKISKQELVENQWILREPGSGTRECFERAIGLSISPLLELGNSEAIKNAVQQGLGLGCLSNLIVANAIESGKLVRLKTVPLSLSRNFYMLLHKQKYQTTLLKAFISSSSPALL